MIIKGQSRSGSRQLGSYLSKPGKNEEIRTLEIRGTVAQDIPGAISEMGAHALGTKCEKPLYHAMINPEPPHRLSDDQCREAVDVLEEKLGLIGHPRVVVMHEKLGRQHLHVAWSRTDLENMTAVSDSHNYRKHEEAARELERRFGHDHVQGVHHERGDQERPDRSPSRREMKQQERTGISGKQVKLEVTDLFKESDNAESFRAALEDRKYMLAQGDRRDFVIVDKRGGIHSLARRIDGVSAKELRKFMSPIDRDSLPDITRAKELQRILLESEQSAKEQKSYGRGDYVSQSSAALADHQRRQKEADERRQTPEVAEKLARLRERFERAVHGSENSHSQDGDPHKQNEALGGGHTTSR